MKFIFYFTLLFLVSCANVPQQPVTYQPANRKISTDHTVQANTQVVSEQKASLPPGGIPYDQIFQKSREVLKQDDNRKQLRVAKSVSESEMIGYLQKNPAALTASQQDLLKIVQKESKAQKDLTKHLRLVPPPGMSGYDNLKIYISHPYYEGKNVVAASNLVKVWNDFLNLADKKIMLNVFDFDLQEIAQTLVRKAKAGVSVTVGIDRDTIKERPQVQAVYEMLKEGGVNAVAVNSINLNHQKMAVIDWDEPATAKVLFSSGNLTQSCLGPEGDLKDIEASKRPLTSVPNANHVMTMDSWLLANLVHNELTKTMDDKYRYRGAQYPILGSYQITGPGVNPETLEAYPENSLIISFSPEGGYRDINENIIGHFIRKSDGPIRMIQFAFSSDKVTDALAIKAEEQKEKFDFLSVGDTPFAMQTWSQFLYMSGLARYKNAAGENEYFEMSDSRFFKALGQLNYWKLRGNIRIAPSNYGNSTAMIDNLKYPVSAKIHHKILSAGSFAIVGTSFNFSKNAQKNNEQILVFKSQELATIVDGMTKWLAERSKRSVYDEAVRRNRRLKKPEHTLLPLDNRVVNDPDDQTIEEDDSSSESKQAG